MIDFVKESVVTNDQLLSWIEFHVLDDFQIDISFYLEWFKVQLNIHCKDFEEVFQKIIFWHLNSFWIKNYDHIKLCWSWTMMVHKLTSNIHIF